MQDAQHMSDEKRRHLRWMEMMWERHRSITHEEKRKEEVLGIFRDLVESSERLLLGGGRGHPDSAR